MTQIIDVKIPDIGDFKDVPIIEVLVKPGDRIEKETALITLETDKASMEIPAPHAGTVKELKVKVDDKVSQDTVILTLAVTVPSGDATPSDLKVAPAASATPTKADHSSKKQPAQTNTKQTTGSTITQHDGNLHAEVLVLGAGPGGYTAAFRAADLGKQVIMIERYASLGGVCLNVGCIPSKALLHTAKTITEAESASQHGITYSKPKVAIDTLRTWKDSVISKLTKGLGQLAKQRKVNVIQGTGKFLSTHLIEVETKQDTKTISFDHCIIAAGSSVTRVPDFPYEDPRIIDSTGALQLQDIPKRMLIIGGGIIGLEMATVYDALGSKISIVELMDQLIPGADPDLVKPLNKRIANRYEAIYLQTRVIKIEPKKTGVKIFFEGDQAPEPQTYDRILVAVGRRPNSHAIGAKEIGIQIDERGFITVDSQQKTNLEHIFAIGDIVGQPMLAHKATYEGKLAAEVIAGHKATFDARTIPSVAYTDPEIAWMGLTEQEAKKQGIDYELTKFPWAASGRAISMACEEGMTKLLFDKNTRRILGAGIVGVNAGELISEAILALEMGTDMEDICLTIHPHPTLSETIFFAAEMAEGTITDLYIKK